jgi:hypothetical protein
LLRTLGSKHDGFACCRTTHLMQAKGMADDKDWRSIKCQHPSGVIASSRDHVCRSEYLAQAGRPEPD